MAVTTKTGDKGSTSLYWGGRVPKDHIRVEAYGNLDELCSVLGLSKSLINEKSIKGLIESIQRDLFVVGAELATKKAFIGKLKQRVDKSYIERLEKISADLEDRRTFKECCFYLPANPISSSLDIARTVARRAERSIVTVKRKGLLTNKFILIYLNRLSDLLYLLARRHEKKHVKLTLEEAR
jgi:ATP:cob(I)alamin adenosyltransferase